MENHILKLAELKLTSLEEKFIKSLISQLYAEPGYSDVTVTEIAQDTGISSRVLRGVQGSLIKKDIISAYDNGAGFVIIYLEEKYWNLHPQWSKSIEE